MSNVTDWMNDPSLQNIPKEKLDFLEKMFFQSQKLTEKEKLPFFLSLAKKAKDSKIRFTPQEVDLILPILKNNATPAELQKIDKVLSMMKSKA